MFKNKSAAIAKVKELTLAGIEENKKTIVAIMVKYKISLTQLFVSEMSRKKGAREEFFKNICEMSGYSFNDLPVHNELKDQIKKTFPDACLGCSQKLQAWQTMFQKTEKELQVHVQKVAAF